MPPLEAIQQYLTGAWRLMMGKADGLRLLDVSADGFWNSFYAIVLALPPMIFSWVSVADSYAVGTPDAGVRLSLMLRFAIVDVGAWVLPYAALAVVAGKVGLSDRFVPYIVAINWSSVLLWWMALPLMMVMLAVPEPVDVPRTLSLVLLFGSLYLTWQVTISALGRGIATGTAVFAGMSVLSLAVSLMLQNTLGLSVADQFPGG